MGAHNLALNLLILALFTLSSVILFEIFTRPPVNVRQNHEVFISFASDYQLQWQDFESNLYYSDESRARASSSASRVVKAQEIARRRRNIMPNQALSGGQHASSSPSMSPVPPLSMSKLNSKIENSKEIDVDDDDRRSRTADTRRSGISAPIQPNRMPGMINNSTSDSSNMVQRMKYAERMPPTVPRMSIPKPSKLQTDKSFNIIHANRSIISAAGKKHINHPAGPRRLGLQCTDPHCTSYLLDEDYWSFMICQQWTEKKTKISHLDINATCRFMKGVTRQPVGLVSVPGSGNTWVRGLLEIATGICTGSIYCDHPLRNEGMIGEYVKTGRVLIVKTHTSDYQWNEAILEERNEDDALYESAILLIRNPFNAFIAEWNRLNAFSTYSGYAIGPKNNSHQNFRKFPKLQRLFKRGIIIKSLRSKMPLGNNSKVGMTKNNGGEYGHALPVGRKLLSIGPSNQSEDVSHTIVIDKKMFGNNSEWDEYVYAIGERWKKTIVEWFVKSVNFSHPIMVVRYEDIKEDRIGQVERMLKFLEFPFNKTELEVKLHHEFKAFKRPHKEEFEHYTPEQKKYVNTILLDTIKILSQHNMEQFFKLEDYLDFNY